MRRVRVIALVLGLAIVPALAAADGTPRPRYPLGFDCSAVPAGSQRQACNRSHLDPPMGAIPNTKPVRQQPDFIQQPQLPLVPAGPPPTIPRLPGTIQNGN